MDNSKNLQPTGNHQQAVMLASQVRSKPLIECLAALMVPGNDGKEVVNPDAKMAMTLITGGLMPSGKPDFMSMKHYTPIVMLVKYGTVSKPNMMKLLLVLLKDFCLSMNVAHNMTEMQMIETAGMMLDECDDWRLEDYTMMFAMAKRGQLGKLMHAIDMGVISGFMDEYYKLRRSAGERAYEEQHTQFLAMQPEAGARTLGEEKAFQEVLGNLTDWKKQSDDEIIEARDKKLKEAQEFWKRQAEYPTLNIDEIRKQSESLLKPKK